MSRQIVALAGMLKRESPHANWSAQMIWAKMPRFAGASGRSVEAVEWTRPLRHGRRQWKHLHRAVDKDGDNADLRLRGKRDHVAARAFFETTIDQQGVPEKPTIDKSSANMAANTSIQADSGPPVEMRQSKYVNDIVEQDPRAAATKSGQKTMPRPQPQTAIIKWSSSPRHIALHDLQHA